MTYNSTPDKRRSVRLLIVAGTLILAAITAIRVHRLTQFENRDYFDKYLFFADSIRSGEMPLERIGDLSPGYLAFIGLLRQLGAGVGTILSIQVVLVSLAAFAAGLAAHRLAGWPAGTISCGFILASRAAYVNATDLEPETLILLFNAMALASLVHFLVERSGAALPLTGLFLGLSALMRPVGIATALLVSVSILASRSRENRDGDPDRDRRIIVPVALLVAIAMLPVLTTGAITRARGGSSLSMDPGTVFYEGMNYGATGYAGVQPAIVHELQSVSDSGPDSLHVVYRLVASEALGRPAHRRDSNAYWLSRSFAFASTEPLVATKLVARKLFLILHSYEAWDLRGMHARNLELGSILWIPFSILLSFAAYGAFTMRRSVERLVPLVVFSLMAAAPMVIFYVTARQRNAVVPAVAVLAGFGAGSLWKSMRSKPLAPALIAAGLVSSGLLFAIPGAAQQEDRHVWTNLRERTDYLTEADRLLRAGKRDSAMQRLAAASVRGLAVNVDASFLESHCRLALQEALDHAQVFDIAIALQRTGSWKASLDLALRLRKAGYRPRRGTRAINSPSYLAARSAFHLQDREKAREYLASAADEAPGDPFVLALMAESDGGEAGAKAMRTLKRTTDPVTIDLARGIARFDLGDREQAQALLLRANRVLPWPSAQLMIDSLDDG